MHNYFVNIVIFHAMLSVMVTSKYYEIHYIYCIFFMFTFYPQTYLIVLMLHQNLMSQTVVNQT